MYACCGIPDGNYCYVAHASAQFMEVCAHTKQEMKGGKGEGGGGGFWGTAGVWEKAWEVAQTHMKTKHDKSANDIGDYESD